MITLFARKRESFFVAFFFARKRDFFLGVFFGCVFWCFFGVSVFLGGCFCAFCFFCFVFRALAR